MVPHPRQILERPADGLGNPFEHKHHHTAVPANKRRANDLWNESTTGNINKSSLGGGDLGGDECSRDPMAKWVTQTIQSPSSVCVCVCVPLCVFCVWSVLPISRAHQVSALRHPIRLQLTHKRAGRSIWWRPYLVIGWRLLCVPIGVGNADREKLIVNYETKKTKALDLSLVSRQTPLEI